MSPRSSQFLKFGARCREYPVLVAHPGEASKAQDQPISTEPSAEPATGDDVPGNVPAEWDRLKGKKVAVVFGRSFGPVFTITEEHCHDFGSLMSCGDHRFGRRSRFEGSAVWHSARAGRCGHRARRAAAVPVLRQLGRHGLAQCRQQQRDGETARRAGSAGVLQWHEQGYRRLSAEDGRRREETGTACRRDRIAARRMAHAEAERASRRSWDPPHWPIPRSAATPRRVGRRAPDAPAENRRSTSRPRIMAICSTPVDPSDGHLHRGREGRDAAQTGREESRREEARDKKPEAKTSRTSAAAPDVEIQAGMVVSLGPDAARLHAKFVKYLKKAKKAGADSGYRTDQDRRQDLVSLQAAQAGRQESS